jgi:hypothetical protein
LAAFLKKSVARQTPSGNLAFMVANYSGEKRRFDSCGTEADVLDAANKLACQSSQHDTKGATLTREQSIEYANAIQILQPLGISLASAIATLAEAIELAGDLSGVTAAAHCYKARNKTVTARALPTWFGKPLCRTYSHSAYCSR